MKKEVAKLNSVLENDIIRCVFVETDDKNWFIGEYLRNYSALEKNRATRHLFWDAVSGVTGKYCTIPVVNDKKVECNNLQRFVELVAAGSFAEKDTKVLHWVLDANMFSDMKENYGKLLYLLKSTNITEGGFKIIFVDSDFNKLPNDLKKFATLIKVPLPTENEISEIVVKRVENLNKDFIVTKELEKELVRSAIGLDRKTIREVLTDSWNKHKDFLPTIFRDTRYDFINKNPCLNSIKWENDSTELIGMQKLKDFVVGMIKSGKGRGVLLVGVAGSGKSQFAKYVGKQTNQLVINLDLAKMKGKYVGDTEKMTRESIETIDTIKNCVVLVDEIEKGLAGVSGAGDSGSSANQGATFLKWLSDKEEGGSYIIATANNIEQLPSEYKRAERWDGIFFLDLPTEEIRKGIIQFYVNHYKLDAKKNKPDDLLALTENWTGAEIKTMCRLASALEKSCVEIATEYVTTIYSVDKEKIDSLREWSAGRTISCDYKREAKQPKPEKAKKLGSIKLNKGEFPNEAI